MAVPTEQKALLLQSFGGAYAVEKIAVPSVEPGEILVRVEAVALNPTDWRGRFNPSFLKEFPTIQGADVAGVVAQLGEGVTRFKVGDRVIHNGFRTRKLAAFQQYTAVSAELAARVPDNLTLDQAAAIPLALIASSVGLYQPKQALGGGAGLVAPWKDGGRGKYADQPTFVLGGSSSLGQFVIQLARLSGFSPIITTVSPKHNGLVTSIGATHPLDCNLSPASLADAIRKITSEPLRYIFDTIGNKETQNTGHDLLAVGGVLVVSGFPAIDKDKQMPNKEVNMPFRSPHVDLNKEFGVELYKHVTELFKSGDLKPTSVEYIAGGLGSISDAQERLRSGQAGALKMIVHPQETI